MRFVRKRCEIESRRLALAAHQQVCGFVRAVRDFVGRQVRQPGQDFVDLRTQPRRFGCGIGLGILVFGDLAQQGLDLLAALFGGADVTGDAVAPRLRLLHARLRRPPRTVQRQHLRAARRQATPTEPAIEFRRVVADPSDVVHGRTKTQTEQSRYRGPRRSRPSYVRGRFDILRPAGRSRRFAGCRLREPEFAITHSRYRIDAAVPGRKRCWD